ncbi:nucleotidyl transferase AbiEii/AbiGii toxin family protein [Enterococcus raffinosus]|uniref:nucleotidyl transferase AbiEii/AbiGii toxin family protein n=1 Tax=Enterococcus raffinosus TaxID=71452 RepID=UPI001C110057|nr:nucleotidyl transferase AbiEii/AbiGii toxin family protein [Enterococcus raffinosus]MBU5361676.1 nucleotidyl transferase AbiEii/AbiGii toxin family protein [Enterococcus raffinosus]
MKTDRLRDLIKNKDPKISFDEYRMRYAAERFLMRVQQSSYRDRLILKGGFLLGVIYQIEQRTTKDLDIMVKDFYATRDSVEQMLKEIVAIELEDLLHFELVNVLDTQKNRIYEGYRAKMKMHMDGNTVFLFDLDIGVGDVITPKPNHITIPLIFNEKKGEKKSIAIYSYPIETVLAEKMETIPSLGKQNSRMKDFYDIHLLLNDPDLPPINQLYEAFYNTWTFRHNAIDEEIFDDWQYTLNVLLNDSTLKNQVWVNYIRTRPYAQIVRWDAIIAQLTSYLMEFKANYLKKKQNKK